ncbi:hypothetical protein Hanom_Chr02g00164991 [Helianthus anomalus]
MSLEIERGWRWSSSDDGGGHVLGGGSGGLGQWLTGFILEREKENEISSMLFFGFIY